MLPVHWSPKLRLGSDSLRLRGAAARALQVVTELVDRLLVAQELVEAYGGAVVRAVVPVAVLFVLPFESCFRALELPIPRLPTLARVPKLEVVSLCDCVSVPATPSSQTGGAADQRTHGLSSWKRGNRRLRCMQPDPHAVLFVAARLCLCRSVLTVPSLCASQANRWSCDAGRARLERRSRRGRPKSGQLVSNAEQRKEAAAREDVHSPRPPSPSPRRVPPSGMGVHSLLSL